MPNKPLKFSFYDVRKIPEHLMNFDFIKEIDYDDMTKEVTLTYRSGTVLPLGSVDPGIATSLTGATLNDNGELIFSVSDGTTINAGRVVSEYTYEDDYVSGTGLLSGSGVYKPLVSGSGDLYVSMDETELSISATFPGDTDLSALDETRIYNAYTWLSESTVEADTSYTTNTWYTRRLNDAKINNLNINVVNGEFTLTKGTYYISGFGRSFRGGITKIAIRDVVNNTTILDSVGAANYAASASSSVKNVISGYIMLESDTTVALQQMLDDKNSSSTLGVNGGGALADTVRSNSELNIWKLSGEILVPPILPEEPIDPLIAALQRNYYLNIANSMTASTSAMGASLSGSAKWDGGVLGPDGKIYGIPRDSTDILIIDPVSGTATRSAMGASLSGTSKFIGGALGPDGKIYGIPFNSSTVLIIDPMSESAYRSNLGASVGSNGWVGGSLSFDGGIFGIPYDGGNILMITPSIPTSMPGNVTLSPYLNKY